MAARLLLSVALLAASAVATPSAAVETVTEVRIERERPKRAKLATLRFLHDHKDFIRSRLDALREHERTRRGAAREVDPRHLAWAQMVAEARAARDTLSGAEADRERHALFESVTRLGALEAQLDQLEQTLEAQRERLGVLETDFARDQRTALMVVAGGRPADGIDAVTVTLEDGSVHTVPLSDAEREALASGGVIQVFHGLIEPREQVIEIGIAGTAAAQAPSGFLVLDPPRDRITLLRLDLTNARLEPGIPGASATFWLHEPLPQPVD